MIPDELFQKALVCTSLLVLASAISASASGRLNGACATFPAKIHQCWFAELAKSGGPQVNVQAVGSGAGRKVLLIRLSILVLRIQQAGLRLETDPEASCSSCNGQN